MNYMKSIKLVLLLVVLYTTQIVAAGNWTPISSTTPKASQTTLISEQEDNITISFKVEGFYLNSVKTQLGEASVITLPNSAPIQEADQPDLPKLSTSIIVPDMALMDIEVVSSSYVEFENMDIAPSKGVLTRDINPATVPYTYGRAYQTDQFYPNILSGLDRPFIIRDVRGQHVQVYPFQYNPVTKVLRVYNEIVVRVYKINDKGENPLIRTSSSNKVVSEFYNIYESLFINNPVQDYTPVEEEGNMLIISHPTFMQAMQPFIDWKTIKGTKVEMVDVSTIGTTANQIKDYVVNYYNTTGLAFLLLVGDAPQIPTMKGGDLGGPSDPAYGYIVGNDHYIDILVGRFSAETVEHVTTMVERTIEYEKYPNTSIDWFTSGIGIASREGTGDNGEYDWEHMRNIRTDLMGYTYTDVAELYEGSQGGQDAPGDPTPSMVADEVNEGASIINYVGHGGTTSWVTSGFSNSHVQSLSNNNKYPFVWSVACVNGEFENTTCFAEAWTRAKNANGPTGALGFLGSTINQSWDSPMCGQDEMVDILVESYSNNIKRTYGGLSFNGMFKMIEKYGSDGRNMADTWLLFGDPSVVVRTAMPTTMNVNHAAQLFMGESTFTVNSNENGAKVALSVNNQLIDVATINNGSAVLSFQPFTAPDSVTIVVTKYNRLPYIAKVPIIPNTGPYLVYNSCTVSDLQGNNNGLAEYGETISLNLTLVNIGVLDSENTTITIQSNDPYINITNPTSTGINFPSGDTLTVENAFEIVLGNDLPNMHNIPFQYTATDGTDSWNGSFSITGHAGVLNLNSYSINDSQNGNNNGMVNAGEEVILNITLKNIGSSAIYNAFNQISINDPYLTVVGNPVREYGDLQPGESKTQAYEVKAATDTPLGHTASVDMFANADLDYEMIDNIMLPIGQIPVAIIDLDGNKNSGLFIRQALNDNNIYPLYTTAFPTNLSKYQTLFVCLGVHTQRHILTNAQGQLLADFLNGGGNLYMEGGDTWKKDPKTAVHNMFKAMGVVDGSDDLATQIGESIAFTAGLSIDYDGDNEYIDHIAAFNGSFNMFKNSSPLYFTAVGNDATTYKTIASVFEFGGLVDGEGDNTKAEYMRRIVEFFEVTTHVYTANFVGTPIIVPVETSVNFNDLSSQSTTSWQWTFEGGIPATSTEQNPTVTYNEVGVYDVTLIVSNGTETDTLYKQDYIDVRDFSVSEIDNMMAEIYPNPASNFVKIRFNGALDKADVVIVNMLGQKVYQADNLPTNTELVLDITSWNSGVYFVNVYANNKRSLLKFSVR